MPRHDTSKPTDRQRAIYDWIVAYHSEHDEPPTLRQIGKQFGITSPNGVHGTIKALRRLGLLRPRSETRKIVPTSAATDGLAAVLGMIRTASESDLLTILSAAHHQMRSFGWSDAMYAPRDHYCDVVEPGSSGIHQARREADGSFIVGDDGDTLPSSPVLARWKQKKPRRRAADDDGGNSPKGSNYED